MESPSGQDGKLVEEDEASASDYNRKSGWRETTGKTDGSQTGTVLGTQGSVHRISWIQSPRCSATVAWSELKAQGAHIHVNILN